MAYIWPRRGSSLELQGLLPSRSCTLRDFVARSPKAPGARPLPCAHVLRRDALAEKAPFFSDLAKEPLQVVKARLACQTLGGPPSAMLLQDAIRQVRPRKMLHEAQNPACWSSAGTSCTSKAARAPLAAVAMQQGVHQNTRICSPQSAEFTGTAAFRAPRSTPN